MLIFVNNFLSALITIKQQSYSIYYSYIFVFVTLKICFISYRPMEFIECDDPTDLKGNKTRDDNGSDGCYKVTYYSFNNNNCVLL